MRTPELAPTAALRHFTEAHGRDRTGWRSATALAVLATVLSVLALTNRRNISLGRRTRPPSTPMDRTLASASPAVVGGSPQRRFYTGANLGRAVTVEDLRAMAHRRLPSFAAEYLEGGGEDEATLARNIAALAEWHFCIARWSTSRGRDVSTSCSAARCAIPVAVAPTGLNGLFWPHADLRLAEAAAEAGVPFAQSTMSNDVMARVARVPGLRYWWQLYVFGPPEVRQTLIERARNAGCEALIVTVDAQIYGNREWEKRTISGPKSLSWSSRVRCAVASALAGRRDFDPRHAALRECHRLCSKGPAQFFRQRRIGSARRWTGRSRGRRWPAFASSWPRKLIIKGLLSVEDIVRAAQIGADAVAISNHGGRQLDWAVAPLDLLPAARQAVGDRIAILVDGGFRRGTDVIKALALGADAVFAGRAVLYGVAAAGKPGARRALDILREEIERDLGLLGVRSVAELSPRLLVRSSQLRQTGTV